MMEMKLGHQKKWGKISRRGKTHLWVKIRNGGNFLRSACGYVYWVDAIEEEIEGDARCKICSKS
jgi:hypothetical protein